MESVVRCIEHGAEDYLPRPVNTTLLRARAGASLEKKRLRDEEKRKTLELARALEQLREANQVIEHEVELIAGIQRALLPQRLPTIAGLEVATGYATFGQAGGDLYDLLPMGDTPGAMPGDPAGPWGILVADASGHGPAAAVLTAVVNAILRAYPTRPRGPGEVLAHLNRHLAAKGFEGSFVTAFFGIFEPPTGRLVYALAGHDAPFRKPAEGGAIERLPDADGMPLGVMDDTTFEERTAQLVPDDVLFLYTDGITEAATESGAMFGHKGVLQSLAAPVASAQDVIRNLQAGLAAHLDGAKPHDDQTMVALRVRGAG
jgi:sigma-B regulation protein RsbU (phosphoserine phosphatase)